MKFCFYSALVLFLLYPFPQHRQQRYSKTSLQVLRAVRTKSFRALSIVWYLPVSVGASSIQERPKTVPLTVCLEFHKICRKFCFTFPQIPSIQHLRPNFYRTQGQHLLDSSSVLWKLSSSKTPSLFLSTLVYVLVIRISKHCHTCFTVWKVLRMILCFLSTEQYEKKIYDSCPIHFHFLSVSNSDCVSYFIYGDNSSTLHAHYSTVSVLVTSSPQSRLRSSVP